MRLLSAVRPIPTAAAAAALLSLGGLGLASAAEAAPAPRSPAPTTTVVVKSTTTVAKPASDTSGTAAKKAPSTTSTPPTTAATTKPATKSATNGSGTAGVRATTAAPRTTFTPTGNTPTSTSAPTASAPTTVSTSATTETPISAADKPALLVDGPSSIAPTPPLRISPITKLWLMAGVLGAAAVALILLTARYWRRTRPDGRRVTVTSGGAIEADRPLPALASLPAQSAPDAVIDRRSTVATTTRTSGGDTSTSRWTGEVKVTDGPRVTGSLVPLAAAPENLDRPSDEAVTPRRRWTGDRWSDCDPKVRATVSASAE